MIKSKRGAVRSGERVPARGSIAPIRADAYPHPSSAAASAVMRGNKKVDTRPELAVRRLIHARGLRYRVAHRIALPELKVRPDIVFTRQRLAVFIDGCFWHGCPDHGTSPRSNPAYWDSKIARNQERDQQIDAALEANGWSVLRAWEHEAPEIVAAAVAQEVAGRQAASVQLRRGAGE
jgi:DNA mismatch endonuclease (patch repair protein)